MDDFSLQARLLLERMLRQGVGIPYTANWGMKSIDEVSIKARVFGIFHPFLSEKVAFGPNL